MAKELRPRPHKRQLLDGEETVFMQRKRSADDELHAGTNKRLETDPETEFIKVPCRFGGWRLQRAQEVDGEEKRARDIIRYKSIKGHKMLAQLTNEHTNTAKHHITPKPNNPMMYQSSYNISFGESSLSDLMSN